MNVPPPSPLVTTSLSLYLWDSACSLQALLTVRCSHVVILVLVIDSQDLSFFRFTEICRIAVPVTYSLTKPPKFSDLKQYFVTSHVLRVD